VTISSDIYCDICGTVGRLVADYDGIYSISDTGDARSRYVPGGRGRLGPWRLLKPGLTTTGYLYVPLYIHGRRTMRRIHQLVADAFLPPKSPADTVVRHLNDNKLDNRVENLARGTQTDNMADSVRNGNGQDGITNCNAKLTEDDVREIRRLYATGKFSQRVLARRFGVSQATISLIVQRKIWKHVV